MRRHAALLALALAGCASGRGAGVSQARAQLQSTAEHVYPVPAEQLWPQVQAHFTQLGFTLETREDVARGHFTAQTGFREVEVAKAFPARVRYHVQVQDVSGGARVRVFRQTVTASDTWHLLLPEQQLAVGRDASADSLGTAATAQELLSPEDPRFGRNFFRDLGTEQALRTRLEGGPQVATGAGLALAPELTGSVALDATGLGAQGLTEDVVLARCGGPSIPGLTDGYDQAVQPGGFLLLGEVHGTREVPRFVGRAVCQVLLTGTPVVLALELPVREQPALDRYLASEGTEEDLAALVHGPFWHRPEQDGRSSEAVVELIERVRQLNRQGLPVALLALDADGLTGSARDEAMAAVLLARRRVEGASLMVVVTGNVHASTERGVPWDAEYTPTGWHLTRSGTPLRSFDLSYRAGTTWDCRLEPKGSLDCGRHQAQPSGSFSVAAGVNHGASASSAKGKAMLALNDSRPHARAESQGKTPLPMASLGTQARTRWTAALERYGQQRPLFVHMAPHRFPRGFDGYFYIAAISASPPARP